MSSLLAKLHFKYNLELVDKHLDWEGESHMYVQWWKPKLRVWVSPRSDSEIGDEGVSEKMAEL